MPDRLPSLIVLVGFWVPPAIAGWMAAARAGDRLRTEKARSLSPAVPWPALVGFVLVYAAAWFYLNLNAMPPYIPGSTRDPRFAPPQAVAWLGAFTAALILPGSALACVLAFRRRTRLST